jgi:hypothetical protein
MTGTVSIDNVNFMWQTVIMPRQGDIYVFGGSLNPNAVQMGTDCSGAVSEVDEAVLFGAQMSWMRQFWTGTFAGANPGDRGPFQNVSCTSEWVCIAGPGDAPAGAVMVVAVLQDPDPSSAHMVCQVLDPDNVTGFGGPGKYVGIESGGQFEDPNGNSTLHIGPIATSIYDREFNQWFYLDRTVVSQPVLTPLEENALTILNVGVSKGIAPIGIQMSYACVYDESNFLMYANAKVEESFNYPHDAVGSDGYSCGPFQQQYTEGWGSVACEMDWACSAGLFFDALARTDYNNSANSPGWRIQQVQRSATVDGSNYDAQWSRAVSLYNTVINAQAEGFLMSLSDQQQADLYTWLGDIHGGLFNSIQSQSPFRALGEGAIWQQHQMPINDDGFIHPQYVAWAASVGDSGSLAVLESLATASPTTWPDRAADIALAQQVLAAVQGGAVIPPPVVTPTPNVVTPDVVTPQPVTPVISPSGINISPAQLITWANDAVTIIGTLGTWATSIHSILGQFLPGASGVVVPSMLAAATTVSAGHTVHRRHQAEKALAKSGT